MSTVLLAPEATRLCKRGALGVSLQVIEHLPAA
jgi:hypothetical protein